MSAMVQRRYCVPVLLVLLAACAARNVVGDACLDSCSAAREGCTGDCSDLVGAARGACLRGCTAEFNQCKAACGKPPSSPPPVPSPKPSSPKPPPKPSPKRSPKPPSGPRDPNCVSDCNDSRAACSGDCGDLVGSARGQCLKECSAELKTCVSACPLAPPPPPGSVLVELAWDRFKAINDGESGSAEPYMWTAFFKIDTSNTDVVAGKLKVKPGASLVTLAGNGAHGNLPTIDSGETKSTPGFTFTPLLLPFTPFPGIKAAIVGSISVLLEEDGVSDNGALAGARTFRDEVDKFLKGLVNQLTLSAGVMLPDLSSGIKDIQNAVIKAIKDEQSFFENLGTILGSPDDFLGNQIVVASIADGVPGGIPGTISIPFATSASVPITSDLFNAGGDGKWQLFGHVRRLKNN